jgi:hypothetical protein
VISVVDRDTIGIRAADGADLIALAFVADSYGRTFRSRAVVMGDRPIATREGMRIVPDAAPAVDAVVDLPSDQPPAHALDVAIAGIEARYGKPTAAFVRVQLEDAGHTVGH